MVLLERGPELALLRGAMPDVSGAGQVVAVTGEAGAGKTSLLRAATSLRDGADGPRPRVLRGLCDPLTTPRPLGPVRDLLAELAPQPVRLRRDTSASALADVAVRFAHDVAAEPTTLVIEDAQWIDEASVEVLRHLVRRIEALPVLLVLTYRDGEVGVGHTLRPLLGDLARLGTATTLALSPLSLDAIGEVLAGTGLDPSIVERLTGGNPFFVTEVARHAGERLPASVRDAVLASTGTLDDGDLEMLQLIATAPDAVDDRMLPMLGVDIAQMRRLGATGLLVRTHRGLGYRHELARLAVRDAIPLGAESVLHARILDGLERIGSQDYAVLVHHAEAAHDRARTSRYASLAAEEATRTGSHSEAVAFLTLALDRSDGGPDERARMLELLSTEQYMVSRLRESIDSIAAAQRLWEQVGDARGVAATHDRWAIVEYYSARRREAEHHALAAAEERTPAQASARATQAFLAYRRNDQRAARQGVVAARATAGADGSEAVRIRCDITDDAADLLAGTLAARGRLLLHAATALDRSLDEVGTNAYSNLAAIDVEQRRFREAEDVLARSIPVTIERDIPVCNHWQTAVRARLHFQRARWLAALEDADAALEGGTPLAAMWPHLVRGLVAVRTGAPDLPDGDAATDAAAHLDAAWDLADRLDEPLSRLPAMSALAELAWTTGRDDPRLDGAVALLEGVAGLPGVEWAVGELLVWLRRLGRSIEGIDGLEGIGDPEGLEGFDAFEGLAGIGGIGGIGGIERTGGRVAEPFRLELAGQHARAAERWVELGAPFERALAIVHGADDEAAGRAALDVEALGATVTAHRCRMALRERGVTRLPARRWSSTQANPSGLTNRQLDVARLVARGLTNAELAQRLYISPKTADHHVSAVLAKLGISSRREVVRRAAELGLD